MIEFKITVFGCDDKEKLVHMALHFHAYYVCSVCDHVFVAWNKENDQQALDSLEQHFLECHPEAGGFENEMNLWNMEKV